jgi:hypothetical protein
VKPVRMSLFALLVAVTVAAHSERPDHFRAKLVGIEEVPAVYTKGSALFTARAIDGDKAIEFAVTYQDLTGAPNAAHVHFGQRDVNGGVSFFLCGGGGQPPCPTDISGSFSGQVTAAEVVGPAAQGIAPGDLAAILQMMRKEVAYANIHTTMFPGGEIRGQVKVVDDDD